jgi:asparagine synthase (glutamine-hydrolysing)
VPEFLERAAASLPEPDTAERFEQAYALFGPEIRCHLVGTPSAGGASAAIQYWLDWIGPGLVASVEAMMAIDCRMGLADDLLLYGDKICMAHSIEARVPMLDSELMAFVESLPISHRVGLWRTKIVHKRTAKLHLSAAIVNRRKKGFAVPFGTWAATIWKSRLSAILLDRTAPHWAWLQRSAVESVLREHLSGYRDRARQLFALTSFCLWVRQFGIR